MRLRVAWLGKTKYPATGAFTLEYAQRLRGFSRIATVETEEFAGAAAEARLLRRAAGARLWLLDPAGKSFTSPAFAAFLEKQAATFAQEMIFAIGAADGFSAALQAVAAGRLSLSPLTLSHELARIVMLEQLYRALAILTNHPYPH